MPTELADDRESLRQLLPTIPWYQTNIEPVRNVLHYTDDVFL